MAAARQQLRALPSYHSLSTLSIPTEEELLATLLDDAVASLFPTLHAALDPIAGEGTTTKTPAEEDYKYWGGDPQPWREGTSNSPITDPDVIAREEERKAAAEDEDASAAPTTEAHADKLHGDGICIAFLLYLTFAFNLWEWKTWEVVQFLVKPATERRGRCRFADLPYVKPFTGPATVFASHCWGGRWGDLVAAVCAGADTRRVVWIDIVAVRQWPGNGADLDFRGVIRRSHATIVAVAPVEGKLTGGFMEMASEREAFMALLQAVLAMSHLPFRPRFPLS